jgi:hypothetical protein
MATRAQQKTHCLVLCAPIKQRSAAHSVICSSDLSMVSTSKPGSCIDGCLSDLRMKQIWRRLPRKRAFEAQQTHNNIWTAVPGIWDDRKGK